MRSARGTASGAACWAWRRATRSARRWSFKTPGTFEPIDDMVGGGPFNPQAGQWTDDTSMALCLATSLIEQGGFDATDQMQRYVRWWRDGYLSSTGSCFDIGITVSDALSRFERDGKPYAGSTDPYAAGNGSLMRLAPVAMYYAADVEDAVAMAASSSMTTHGARGGGRRLPLLRHASGRRSGRRREEDAPLPELLAGLVGPGTRTAGGEDRPHRAQLEIEVVERALRLLRRRVQQERQSDSHSRLARARR